MLTVIFVYKKRANDLFYLLTNRNEVQYSSKRAKDEQALISLNQL